MGRLGSRSFRVATIVVLLVAGVLLITSPDRAPMAIVVALALTACPLTRAWRAARGTALRSSVIWAGIAVGLGVISQVAACGETVASGRPVAGHWTYLTTLATIAMLISILGARTPGGGAWAILMSLLVLVFLIPWLEGSGLRRGPIGLDRLRLEQPWGLFYGLLVVAGVTNFLPTRYRLAAASLALGFFAEYRCLTSTRLTPESLAASWSTLPYLLAVAIALADVSIASRLSPSSRLEGIWFWFRDHWGVVWALRVQERFNASADAQGWPIRLTWHGVVFKDESALDLPESAEATMRSLLRRFATPERIDEAISRAEA
jgi:hypothetical protein